MPNDSFKILVIEDNPGDAALIRAMLTESVNCRYEMEHVSCLAPGLARISSGEIDAVLLDLHLPDSHGIETYKKMYAGAGGTPIVVLTGLQDEMATFDLYRHGVQNYFVKGQVDHRMLTLCIRNAIDRARAKLKLQSSEARFRRLIGGTADTILIVDKDGVVRFINPAGELLFKTTSKEFLGQPFGFPVVEDESVEIELFGWRENPVIAEMRVVETDWEGEPAWLASIREITDRKLMERALEKTSRKLEQSVLQLQTANEKIIADQNALLEEERLKVLLQMAASTAHELNQPLTVLLGNIEMVESLKNDPEGFSECLQDIEEAGKEIGSIVKKIQNIRKYETKSYVDEISIIKLDQTVKILSVEDSDDDFETIKKALSDIPLINLIRAVDIGDALKIMKQETFDLILLDHILPDGTSFNFTKILNQNNVNVPVIIVTGQGDEIMASRLIMKGAYDYIPKSMISKDVLNRSIRNATEKFRLKHEINHMHKKIREMEIKDKLTGLYNRRHFQEMLENEMARKKRYGHELIMAMIELDHFKRVNDTHGHLAGDMVLTTVGKIIKDSVRENDVSCRYGWQEFTILMPNIGLKDARQVCDRLREKVGAHPFIYESSTFQISISIGIAEYGVHEDKRPEDFIKKTGAALNQAKEQGRNRVILSRC